MYINGVVAKLVLVVNSSSSYRQIYVLILLSITPLAVSCECSFVMGSNYGVWLYNLNNEVYV